MTRRLINDILLDKESDELPNDTGVSNFEMCPQAMKLAGPRTTLARHFVPLCPLSFSETGPPLTKVRPSAASAYSSVGSSRRYVYLVFRNIFPITA